MTLKQMAEQVILRYKGSRPTQDTDLDEREVYDLIIKVLNTQLKMEYLQINLPQQERYVPNAGIASYEIDVLAEVGQVLVDTKCYDFGQFRYNQAGWSTENDEPWTTESGDTWSTGYVQEIKVVEKGTAFEITISGFTLPYGKTEKMLYDFITAGKSNSYITVLGVSNAVPNVFANIAISNVVVTANSIKFDYSDTLASLIDPELLPTIGPTLDKLRAGTYKEFISDIRRCDNIITDTRGRAKIDLPAQPIAIPRGMGIWHIGDYRDINSSYIPIQPGESAIIRGISHTGINSAIGRSIAYEWYSNQKVYFNKKVSEMPPKVLVRLVVADPSTIGEYDLLPIPADKEYEVITKVLELLQADGQPDLKTDKIP